MNTKAPAANKRPEGLTDQQIAKAIRKRLPQVTAPSRPVSKIPSGAGV